MSDISHNTCHALYIVAQIAQFQLNYLSMHIHLCLPSTIHMIILFNNNYYNNIIYNIFIISYLIYLLFNNISIYIIINIVISHIQEDEKQQLKLSYLSCVYLIERYILHWFLSVSYYVTNKYNVVYQCNI